MLQKRNIQASETSAQTVGHNSPKKYSIWQNNNRKIWLASVLLIAGLVLTCTVTLSVKRGVESSAKKEFDFACGEIKDRILTRLHAHAQLLRSASGLFESADEITREAWTNFITRQKIERNLPGIQGIGYSVIIPIDQLALHERKIRNEGFPQYAVKPVSKRDTYTSIIYLEPFSERNLRAFGYDMFSEPIRRKAMEHARDFDEATLSGKITLVQETVNDIQAGTLIYVPVYERGLPVRTIEERRRAIRGWVYSPYRMNDLMRGTLGAWELGKGKQIRLEVFDDTSFQSEALLYDSGLGQKLELTSATMFSEQTSILFNDHRWSLRFTQIGDQTGIVDYSKAWYVLIGGTLVSALLFALCFLLIMASNREQALAEALTRELRESTDRKRAEEALRESEQKYRVLFEGSIQGILATDIETGRFVFVNPSICQMFGYSETEFLQLSITDIHPKDSLNHVMSDVKAQIRGEQSGSHAVPCLRKDSTVIYADITGSSTIIKGQRCVVGFFTDVTERKQAEERLQESEERQKSERDRLELILKTAQDGFWLVDASTGHLVDVNEASSSMLGYTREELLTHGLTDIDAQWSSEEIGREMQKIKTNGNALFETRHRAKGGQIIDVEISVNYLPATDQFFSFIRNIAGRKQAEAVLRESEELLTNYLENAPEGVYMNDLEGTFLYGNHKCEEITGYRREELIGKNLLELNLLSENSFDKAVQLLQANMEGKPTGPDEIELVTKEGCLIPVEINTGVVQRMGQRVVLSFVHDITERKQAEEKIRQMAYHDSLTGLPNRKLFSDRLGIALAQAQRNQKGVAVTMLDLDNFKNVNDTLGHDVGDLLLKAAAERLIAALRKGDTVARFGGDEFALILPDLKAVEDAIKVAQKIVDNFRNPFLIDTHQLVVTTSIGIAVYPNDGTEEGTLLKNADIAMYQAKQAGRARYQLYKKG